ncbi:hypothetical protein BBO99_00001055 [Phytophthora kernoviae]|uniref:NACHT domain-containing protein n=2 Tax=Phytophthora kernoviae TaxID=325452 RepID=A0A3R7FZ61_9STRA|nr:hypothetical protein G195_009013 [Phytophthora kernoviae 00238/432]KAG2532411.1 hypothetical protein JM16_000402 [Phytophthora kernoviae]KAG2533428.1 hypothetical protein JM18_000319 [Phytophthora kernoviae]RLN06702.1 hypothetical protein BBI17_001026 [Phytophthora kernoviae]RLN84734.1 hypothetical protein BBO99_00001055 [Phytophthora kernoviae]
MYEAVNEQIARQMIDGVGQPSRGSATASTSEDKSDTLSDCTTITETSSVYGIHNTWVDLATLYSLPFVMSDSNRRLKPVPPLNIAQEQSHLNKIFQECQRAVHTMRAVATVDSLRKVLDRGVTVLHFSGHGGRVVGKSQYLMFEDTQCSGLAHLVDATTLRRKVLDESSAMFSYSFYHAALTGKTVQQSFEIARVRVSAEMRIPDGEGDQFVLLESSQLHAETCPLWSSAETPQAIEVNFSEESCSCNASTQHFVFSDIAVGKWVDVSPSNKFSKTLPGVSESFVGREQELHMLAELVSTRRLVTLRGPPGIGKSTLSIKLAHFLADRNVFADGVAFIRLRGVQSLEGMESTIKSALFPEAGREKDMPLDQALSDMKVLLVMDNMEDPINANPSAIRDFLLQLLQNTPSLSFLMTARQAMGGGINEFDEKVVSLNRLSHFHAADLFIKKSPRALLVSEIGDIDASNRQLTSASILEALVSHPLMAFLDVGNGKADSVEYDIPNGKGGSRRILRDRNMINTLTRSGRASRVAEHVDRMDDQAELMAVCVSYSTFPFIASYARSLLGMYDGDGAKNDILQALCVADRDLFLYNTARHFRKVSFWVFQHICTLAVQSSAAYLILDLHESNLWMILNLHIRMIEEWQSETQTTLPGSSRASHITTNGDGGVAADGGIIDGVNLRDKISSYVEDVATYLAHSLFLSGRHRGAWNAANKALHIAKQHKSTLSQANIRKLMGILLTTEMKFDEAKAQFGTALILYKTVGNKIGQAASLSAIGMIHSRNGNLRGAHNCFTKALTLSTFFVHDRQKRLDFKSKHIASTSILKPKFTPSGCL